VPHLSELAIECPCPSDSRLANVPDVRFAEAVPELQLTLCWASELGGAISKSRPMILSSYLVPVHVPLAMKRIGEMRPDGVDGYSRLRPRD